MGLSENWTRTAHLSSVAQHSSGGYTVRYFLAMRSLAIIGPTTSLFFRNTGQVQSTIQPSKVELVGPSFQIDVRKSTPFPASSPPLRVVARGLVSGWCLVVSVHLQYYISQRPTHQQPVPPSRCFLLSTTTHLEQAELAGVRLADAQVEPGNAL